MQFSDKDICSDTLLTEKFLTEAYNKSITECSNPELRQDFVAILQETQNLQRQVFETMSSRGWYQANQATSADIAQLQRQFQGSSQQMGSQFQHNYQQPGPNYQNPNYQQHPYR